jgi:hypothetical protein
MLPHGVQTKENMISQSVNALPIPFVTIKLAIVCSSAVRVAPSGEKAHDMPNGGFADNINPTYRPESHLFVSVGSPDCLITYQI